MKETLSISNKAEAKLLIIWLKFLNSSSSILLPVNLRNQQENNVFSKSLISICMQNSVDLLWELTMNKMNISNSLNEKNVNFVKIWRWIEAINLYSFVEGSQWRNSSKEYLWNSEISKGSKSKIIRQYRQCKNFFLKEKSFIFWKIGRIFIRKLSTSSLWYYWYQQTAQVQENCWAILQEEWPWVPHCYGLDPWKWKIFHLEWPM